MKESRVPYKRMIFVCVNQREKETACANLDRGENSGSKLLESLKEELNIRGLKGKIRVARSGCMDLCSAGPNLMVFDDNGRSTWHSGVTLADLPEIIEKYFTL